MHCKNLPWIGATFGVGIALIPLLVHAQIAPPVAVPPASFGPICAATGLCASSPSTGIWSIESYLSQVIVPAIKTIFIGIAVLYVAWYALSMIMFGGEESVQTEQRKAFGDAARGMAFIGIASFLVDTFAPSATGAALLNETPFTVAINRIVDFLTLVTGAFLIFIISLAGFRIIVLQGDESEIDKQKKNFFNGLIGVALLLTARIGVLAILPTGSPDAIVVEIGGIIRFLLEIMAGLAVVSLIASGALYIVALHSDTLRQRAKRILLSTVIILIIVIFAHVLIATFLPATAPPSAI